MSSVEKAAPETPGEGAPGKHIAADSDAAGRPPRVPPNAASVKINVEGAFIVDDEVNGKNGAGAEGVYYEHKDIRLPHHTAVVSHVAVDVSLVDRIFEHVLTPIDRRLACKVGLLLTRTWLCDWRWETEFPELRDRPNRPLHRFHTRPEEQAVEAQWIKPGGSMRHGNWRWCLQVLQPDEGDPARGCHSRGRNGMSHNRYKISTGAPDTS